MSVDLQVILKSQDQASAEVKGAIDRINESYKDFNATQKAITKSYKMQLDGIKDVTNVMSNIGSMADRVAGMYDKWNVSQIRVTQAQEALDEAVVKHGKNSDEATEAQERLTNALNDQKVQLVALGGQFLTFGSDVVRLIPNLGKLIPSLYGVGTASGIATVGLKAMALAAGEVALAIGALALTGWAIYTVETSEAMDIAKKTPGIFSKGAGLAGKLAHSMDKVSDSTKEVTKSTKELNVELPTLAENIWFAYSMMGGYVPTLASIEAELAKTTESVESTTSAFESMKNLLSPLEGKLIMLTNEFGSTYWVEMPTQTDLMTKAFQDLASSGGLSLTGLSGDLSAFQTYISEWSKNVKDELSGVVDAFAGTKEEVVSGSIWPEMWEEIGKETEGGLDENIDAIKKSLKEARKLLEKPFYLNFAVAINAANLKAQIQKIITDTLKSVTIEKTSVGATTSKIRVPTTTQRFGPGVR